MNSYYAQSQSLSGFEGPASLRKVHFWSSDRVVRWLRKYCNEHSMMYGHLFEEHEITGMSIRWHSLSNHRLQAYSMLREGNSHHIFIWEKLLAKIRMITSASVPDELKSLVRLIMFWVWELYICIWACSNIWLVK